MAAVGVRFFRGDRGDDVRDHRVRRASVVVATRARARVRGVGDVDQRGGGGTFSEQPAALGGGMGISPAVLGVTVLAWGNSAGDLVADVIVAKSGEPMMAVAACYSGPLFNAAVGLGLAFSDAAEDGAGTVTVTRARRRHRLVRVPVRQSRGERRARREKGFLDVEGIRVVPRRLLRGVRRRAGGDGIQTVKQRRRRGTRYAYYFRSVETIVTCGGAGELVHPSAELVSLVHPSSELVSLIRPTALA